MAPYGAYWRQRREREREHCRRLAEEAWSAARAIAAALRRDFGATRVLVFGSLVRGQFLPDSDIDLAVEGVAPADFFPALAQAGKLTRFPVDLKPLEDLESHFKARVLETGVEV